MVASTAATGLIGRYTLGSDRVYEAGRESYYKQMKDPKVREEFLKKYKK